MADGSESKIEPLPSLTYLNGAREGGTHGRIRVHGPIGDPDSQLAVHARSVIHGGPNTGVLGNDRDYRPHTDLGIETHMDHPGSIDRSTTDAPRQIRDR